MSTASKERKVSQSAPSKIDSVVRQLFLPMLTMPTPEYTSFQQDEHEQGLMRQVAQDNPGVLESEEAFVRHMVGLYRKFHDGAFDKGQGVQAALGGVTGVSLNQQVPLGEPGRGGGGV